MQNEKCKMKNAVIIVAAGSGKRMGADKAVMSINGKPLFYYSCLSVLKLKEVSQVVLVIKPKHFNLVKTLFGSRIGFISGGKERNDSVANGLSLLRPEITHVLVHDAARPFTSQAVFKNVLKGLRSDSAVICGIFAQDTVKLVRRGVIIQTLPRNEIFLAQTPQGFEKCLLLKAYKNLKNPKATDDAQVVQLFGKKIKVVEGSRNNIKITFKEDVKSITASLA